MDRPNIVTPRTLFQNPAKYVAPVFQRYYVWGEEQLDDFFDDLDELSAGEVVAKQFLGAIVLQQKDTSSPAAPTVYLMIDGQQRLTTLYLVVLALAAVRGGDEGSALIENYLAVNLAGYRGQPKVVPTAQDREAFYALLSRSSEYDSWNFADAASITGVREELTTQYKRVVTAIEERVLGVGRRLRTGQWDKLTKMVLDRFEMVSITLEPNEDPNLIFGRLNARGTDLTVADLVRNSVFSRFPHDRAQASERFYHDKWLPFERSFPAKHGLQKYFQPFAVIRTGGKATQATAFPQLEALWAHKKAEAVLADLQQYSLYFARLNKFESISDLPEKVNAALRDLAEMPKLSVSWPFIIQVLHATHRGGLDRRNAERSLRLVESMLVRRALMGWEPTGLHAIFKSLWNETGGDPAKVAARIQTGTIKSPTDKELMRQLQEFPSDRRKILPYVLKQYERMLRSKEGIEEVLPIGSGWIEHVLPQALAGDWCKTFTESQHKGHVGLLGNLSLMTGKQNQKLQNQPFEQKRERFRTSDWLITRNLASTKTWDSKNIRNRTRHLMDWILRRWPALPSKKLLVSY